MSRITREGNIRIYFIRGSIGVVWVIDKTRDISLRWLGDILRRYDTEDIDLVKNMYVDG